MDHDHASRSATTAAAATIVYCFGCQVPNELTLAVFFWDELFSSLWVDSAVGSSCRLQLVLSGKRNCRSRSCLLQQGLARTGT
jgi:hypothetical protein